MQNRLFSKLNISKFSRWMFWVLVSLFCCNSIHSNSSYEQESVTEIPLVLRSINDSLDHFRFTDTSQYLKFTGEVKRLAELRRDDQILSYYHFFKGFYETDRGRYNEADRQFSRAIDISKTLEIVDHRLLFQVYYQSAFVKSRLEDVQLSRKCYWLTYDHAQMLNDSSALALASYGVTSMLVEMNNYREAKSFAKHTLSLDLALNDSIAISYDYGTLGVIYFKMNMYEKAYKNYELARLYNNREKSLHQYCNLTNALADVSIKLNNYEEALSYAEDVIQLAKSSNFLTHFLRARIHKAHVQYLLGSEEIAINDFKDVINVAEEQKIIREQIRGYYLLGTLAKDHRSLSNLTKAYQIAKETNTEAYLELILKAINKRIQYSSDNDLKDSFNYAYINFLEATAEENRASMVNGMDASFKLHTLDEMNAKLELANSRAYVSLAKERFKRLMLYGLIVLGLFSFASYYFFSKQKQKIRELEYDQNVLSLKQQLTNIVVRDNPIQLPSLDELNSKIVGNLTHKEYEIVKNVLDRKTNAEIAELHFISINTVKFHLKNIHIKLETANKKAVIEKIRLII